MDSPNRMDTYNENAAMKPPPINKPTEPFQTYLRPDVNSVSAEDPFGQYLRNTDPLLLNDMDAKQSLDSMKQQTSTLETVSYPSVGDTGYPNDHYGPKRKKDTENDDIVDARKLSNNMSAEEKKTANMRKNIREVFDENQLDTNTLAAQREESERLARVAEQQKIIRETQRQAAVNRSFVRTQNKVLSLLQSGTTFAKVTSETPFEEIDTPSTESELNASSQSLSNSVGDKLTNKLETETVSSKEIAPISTTPIDDEDAVKPAEEQVISDVVTIEDSSSEDDCIMLSDDEEDLEDEEEADDPGNSGLHVKDAYNIPDEQGRVLVNIGHPEGEDDIFVAPQIARTIKPHQIGGVRFLFDNIIESTKRFKSSSGFGCILSHSMGLGKTLQVICFCDIFLRHTPSKTVLCVMPINTLQNWVSEFNMWLPKYSDNPENVRPRQFDVFILNDQHKTLTARAKVILKWAEEGGVLLIGYELFRLLALKLMTTRKRRSNKAVNCERNGSEMNRRLMESVHQALVKPGPDLVICDEGHRIKNAHAGISLALKQIRTRRRIVLTGYPLQNNLLEYWCMVDFVRPNYLGTRNEFCNMFERPIQNGQCIDSTPEDHKLMRYRAHVLHSLLLGFVQRRSHVVLQQTLPKKLEYVVLTRMTSFQRQLYDTFMNDIVRTKSVPNPLKAFAVCCKIWNHPDVLYSFLKRKEIDLELEMEETDVIGEPPIVPPVLPVAVPGEAEKSILPQEDKSIESASTDQMGPDIMPKEHTSSEANSPAPECKMSGQQSPAACEVAPHEIQALVVNKPNTVFSNLMKSSLLSDPYNQQQNDDPSYLGGHGNHYWQESNVNYFPYQSVTDNIESLSKPNYVGMVPQRAEETPNETNEGGGSSQIVDLDTKEIKTVETDIDMTLCPVIKNEALQGDNNSLLTNTSSDGTGITSADSLIEDVKLLTSASTLGNEKDAGKGKADDATLHEWAMDLMKKYRPGLVENSPKMEIFFCILNESVRLGDRVLLFSQSLLTLNLIETFLQMTRMPDSDMFWGRGLSYFRLDGSTTSQERERLVNEFNSNASIKLFLISTRAGSLGINLVGANRVIVFDASWNPCHDTQAVYRIYRYGQRKPCFVYRIVMDKCLEKKIYDRQIKKQGMSDRVVDECNPDAHLSIRDITNLCHDYDDDEKIQSEVPEFTTPLESFEDVLIRKIVVEHKTSLSKEPFFHESLLIDRKEKKLSQAEKRQAHRGYEMEKKASVKQAFCAPVKNQYRIVRNDGSIVTRPVASIRPMQTTKTMPATKSGGIRTTRWIPAEVWQRQGMTAQEMTLPLDVVIPTHSNDKSNIILKSGQRVMVLKSAKGIYMQLESGKIIAIRTSSKATEVNNKTDKDEVIDITNEGDTTSEKKSEETKTDNANQKENDNTAKGSQNSCTEVTEKSTGGFDKCTADTNAKKSLESSSAKSKEFPQANQYKADLQMPKDDINTKFDSLKKVEHKPNPISIEKAYASHINDNTTKQEFANTARGSQKLLAPKPQQQQQQQQNQQQIEESVALKKNEGNHHQQDQHHELEQGKKEAVYPLKHSLDKNNPPQTSLMNQKCLPQYTNKPMAEPAPYPYKQMGNYPPFCGLTPPDLSKYTNQRGDMMTPTESFQTCNYNKRKLQKEMPISTDYTPSPSSSSSTAAAAAAVAASATATAAASSSSSASSSSQSQALKHSHLNAAHSSPYAPSPYSSLFHQQQQPKLHLYGSNYNIDNEHYSNLTQNSPHSTQNLNQNHSLIGDTFGAVQDNSSTGLMHAGGGQNVPAPCDYSTHFPDYAAYSSYNHPHYFSPFANSYGNGSSAPIGTNPYQMHWSPLIGPTSINEQCNPVHSSVYPQNGAQHNQWHHKL
ncbi:PREDICTED: helicase ARIP4 isoform X2 [Rhagoletis zephyria]|nr:PREDICTED: helicase ARIP4 isoform X2 [Rhagoletis zephyria]XP_017466566.1 PREDICTED: helicase ARIP4 isoform X2 [Rhagoletis zephyria]